MFRLRVWPVFLGLDVTQLALQTRANRYVNYGIESVASLSAVCKKMLIKLLAIRYAFPDYNLKWPTYHNIHGLTWCCAGLWGIYTSHPGIWIAKILLPRRNELINAWMFADLTSDEMPRSVVAGPTKSVKTAVLFPLK